MALGTPTLTDLSTKAQIFLSESPIHFNLQNILGDTAIEKVTAEVYIWRGEQEVDLPAVPNLIFKDIPKISPHDDYITIEISNEVKAFITSSNLNKNNPQWAYNTTKDSSTSGEGVYFQVLYQVENTGEVLEAIQDLGSYFATTGYRYSFEQKGGPYTTFNDIETPRKHAIGINYDASTINLGTSLTTSQSGTGVNGMISKVTVNPASRLQQTGVKCLVAYVNRLGVWDTFTPFGKFTESIDTKRDAFPISFRNALGVNSQIQHLESTALPKGMREFQINTGLIDENNNYQIQELLQSSKVYLVIFNGNIYTAAQTGITVDSTIVTVDNTAITSDSDTVTIQNIGFYSEFVQIPVKKTTSNFLRKTRLNDKSSISYTLSFEETNNFINDIV